MVDIEEKVGELSEWIPTGFYGQRSSFSYTGTILVQMLLLVWILCNLSEMALVIDFNLPSGTVLMTLPVMPQPKLFASMLAFILIWEWIPYRLTSLVDRKINRVIKGILGRGEKDV